MLKRLLVAALAILLAAAAGGWAYATRHPAIAAIEPPDPSGFAPDRVAQGEALAALGNCAVCHSVPGGDPYAGGYAIPTPFGTLYSTNITPDPEHGIGRWSEAAFARALRSGVSRSGSLLYPALPYDHFTRATDEDVAALYAWVMSQPASASVPPANALRFPFGFRPLLAGWQLLFLDEARFAPSPDRSAEWNRGAYLVEGLGHCGACHTPRNALGAADPGRHFAGTTLANGWHAPALDATTPAVVPWTADSLVNYLLDGWDRDHGVADGPMTHVVDNLGMLSEDDVYAIAEYLLSSLPPAEGDRAALRAAAEALEFPSQAPDAAFAADYADAALRRGFDTFARACANCHRRGTETVPLALTPTVHAPNAAHFLNLVREGIKPPRNTPDKTMPAFAAMSDADLRDLAAFVRRHFTDRPAWGDLPPG